LAVLSEIIACIVNDPVGTEGAVESEQAGVLTLAALLFADWLPALSTADTV